MFFKLYFTLKEGKKKNLWNIIKCILCKGRGGNVKYNKKSIYVLLSLLLVMFIVIQNIGCNSNKDVENEKVVNYLIKNNTDLEFDNQNDLLNFKKFNKDISKKDIILLGIEDGTQANEIVELKLLEYLNEYSGVTSLLSGLQYSEGKIIDKYLSTGNEEILNKLFECYRFTNKWSKENLIKLKNIYNYNRNIPKERRIKIYGLNSEKHPDISFLYINMLLKGKKIPESIKPFAEKTKDYVNIKTYDEAIEYIVSYEKIVSSNEKDLEECFGEDYEDLKYIMQNLKEGLKISDNSPKEPDFLKFDENTMISNFSKIYKKNSGKYFGIFGNEQVYGRKEGTNKFLDKSFAANINNRKSKFYGKTLIISTIYKNSSKLLYKKTFNDTPLNNTLKDAEILFNASKSNIALYKLNSFLSPFNMETRLVNSPEGGKTTDYFQYVLAIKNSDAVTPLRLSNYGRKEEDEIISYLKENNSSIVTSVDDYSSFKLLDKDVKDNEVFLTGEVHAAAFNDELNFAFIKYFINAGIKYYLAEMGYSSSQLINMYLKTGDETYLKQVYSEFAGTQFYTIDSYDFWKKVYVYNKNLPEEKKIRVVGIDIEHEQNTAWRYLNSILPQAEAPKEIKSFIDILRNKVCKGSEKEDKLLLTDILDSIKDNESIYKKYLKDEYFDFYMVCKNLLNSIEVYQGKGYDYREDAIYNNFVEIYNYLPKGKYYGQFGSEHVFQHSYENEWIKGGSLAAKLAGDGSPVKNNIITILYTYSNCMHRNVDNTEGYILNPYNDVLLLDSAAIDNFTLFKLNGDNSPFNEHPYIINAPFGGVTTDYIQYVVLIRNSPSSKPYMVKNK